MSTDTQQVVSKAWNFAHVLRDDGLSYMAYVEQITFLLFLKMADEQTKLRALQFRNFDPTLSAASGHEDKGLIECLMVVCTQGVPLHVANGLVEEVFCFHRETVVTPLIEMAVPDLVTMLLPPFHMRVGHLPHERGKIAIPLGPNDKMGTVQ